MHVDTPGQDTQNNWPVGASGFGLGTFAHPDPDALAPAGTANAVAVRATDTMTAKKTRNRTGRMGPPLAAPGCQATAEVTGPYTCASRLVNGDEWTISIGHAAGAASHRHGGWPRWFAGSPSFPARREIRAGGGRQDHFRLCVDQARSPVAVALPSQTALTQPEATQDFRAPGNGGAPCTFPIRDVIGQVVIVTSGVAAE